MDAAALKSDEVARMGPGVDFDDWVDAHTSWWRRFRPRESRVAEVRLEGMTDPAAYDDRLWQACRRLPEDQRDAVVLRFYEDMEHADIAALTGVRDSSVRSRVSRASARLRQELGEDDE